MLFALPHQSHFTPKLFRSSPPHTPFQVIYAENDGLMKPEVNQTFRINTMRIWKVTVRGKDDGSFQVGTRLAETSSAVSGPHSF